MHTRGIFCLLAVIGAANIICTTPLRAQQWDWVQRFQGDASAGTAVGVDAAQNVYLAGTFTGTNYIGAHKLDSANGDNLFLAKFDSFGAVQWVITAAGSLNKMLVSSNGAVFICGQLTLHPPAAPTLTSNIMLARLDEGVLKWAETAEDFAVASMSFGPDELISVLGLATNLVIKQFTTDGELIRDLTVPGNGLKPINISLAPSGDRIYVSGWFSSGNLDLGTTNVPKDFASLNYVIAALDGGGAVKWAWNAGSWYSGNPIKDIKALSDGGLISLSESQHGIGRVLVLTRWSANGEVLWRHTTDSHRTYYYGSQVAVTDSGDILVVGETHGWFQIYSRYWPRNASLLARHAADGTKISSQYLVSPSDHANRGIAIATDHFGDAFLAGSLQGQPWFGSNKLIAGYSPVPTAFVARQSTFAPTLTTSNLDNDVLVSWPRTGVPFVLQCSSGQGDWSNVSLPPVENGLRNEVRLPADDSMLFRLVPTNEVRIQYVPELRGPWLANARSIFDHSSVLILKPGTNTPVSLRAWAQDEDGDLFLSATWRDIDEDRVISTGSVYYETHYMSQPFPVSYSLACNHTNASLSPGSHMVELVISDGDFFVTNSLTFEVLSFSTALSELGAALQPYASNSWGRLTMKLFARVEEAVEREKPLLAAERLRRFQKHLQFNKLLTEEDRARCVSAASQLEAVLRAE